MSICGIPRRLKFTCKTATAVGVMPCYSTKVLACQGIRQALEEPDELENLTGGEGDWHYGVKGGTVLRHRKTMTCSAKFNTGILQNRFLMESKALALDSKI
ncbi:secreted protein [Candidatus Thiomargarita nelsonii]|uniref:Secreted protein n=1 Tax=Candidatus Thiomargarita nelsonii TaxID=1003181 RepID=A0A176S0D4_9GAMM|nr:secreted protein [Candidatus Thiomargarita nelsonii]